jgi:hypothetical protein
LGDFQNPSLLVVTTRKPVDGAQAELWFGPEGASALNVARATLTSLDESVVGPSATFATASR